MDSLPRSTRSSRVGVSPSALPESRRSFPGQGLCYTGRPRPVRSRVDTNGISQVPRWSVPYLCSVPGPRSNRLDLASDGHIGAAPAIRTAKASALADIGAIAAASVPATIRFARSVAVHAQGSLPAGRLAFTGRELNPLDHYERFQCVLTYILLSCSPDATGYRAQERGALIRATP